MEAPADPQHRWTTLVSHAHLSSSQWLPLGKEESGTDSIEGAEHRAILVRR